MGQVINKTKHFFVIYNGTNNQICNLFKIYTEQKEKHDNVIRGHQQKTRKDSENPIRYLGIHVTAQNEDLYKDNYQEVWESITEDLQRLERLKMLWLGRIFAV